MPTEQEPAPTKQESTVASLSDSLTSERFQTWYRERQRRRNIENGRAYFNGPSAVPEPERHSPSKLLQCHRKVFYRQENAPKEQPEPTGIFWFGTHFEEEVALPFLRESATGPDEYVTNSIWVDFTVETEVGELQVRGETDPVIVDKEGSPLLLTEIKTKSSVENLTSPNDHHKAQLHAYLAGLSKEYTLDMYEGIIMYASQKSFDMKFFPIEFDEAFWKSIVLEWATDHTRYRLNEELPPPKPEFGWECDLCNFRNRCGKTEDPHSDAPAKGLLPLREYPKEQLEEYLQSHQDAKLTPSLGVLYPELAEKYGSYSWSCPVCSEKYAICDIDWGIAFSRPPLCPICGSEGRTTPLSGPSPTEQAKLMKEESV